MTTRKIKIDEVEDVKIDAVGHDETTRDYEAGDLQLFNKTGTKVGVVITIETYYDTIEIVLDNEEMNHWDDIVEITERLENEIR